MALCNPKTLRALHAVGKQLGYVHEDLSLMTDSGSLATTPESVARDFLEKLRAQLPDRKDKPQRIWRLYSSNTLAREIEILQITNQLAYPVLSNVREKFPLNPLLRRGINPSHLNRHSPKKT